jgi:hypothetical protein
LRSEARQTGDSENSGWGDSNQDDQEDTTKTSSDTVIENSMVDKSPIVHIENIHVSDMASSLVFSPPYAGGEDELLVTTEAQVNATGSSSSSARYKNAITFRLKVRIKI